MVSFIWSGNPCLVSSPLLADTELAKLTSLAETPQRDHWRSGSEVDYLSKTVIFWLTNLSWCGSSCPNTIIQVTSELKTYEWKYYSGSLQVSQFYY